jgi:hypothetical protein
VCVCVCVCVCARALQIAYEPVGSFVRDWFEHYRGILILYIPCLIAELTYMG